MPELVQCFSELKQARLFNLFSLLLRRVSIHVKCCDVLHYVMKLSYVRINMCPDA